MAASWTDSWWSVDENKWSWSSDVHDKWSWSASEVDENQWSWSASEVDENKLNQRWMAEVCTRLEKSDHKLERQAALIGQLTNQLADSRARLEAEVCTRVECAKNSWEEMDEKSNQIDELRKQLAEVCTRLEKSDQTDEPSPGLKTAQGICQNTKVENGRRGVKNGQKK